MRHTTLGRNDAALAKGVVEELEVRLLEEALSRTLGVRRVRDDDIKGVLVVVEKLEAVANVDSGLGVGETSSHLGEELLGDAGDSLLRVTTLFIASCNVETHLVNVAENSLLDAIVLDNLAENTTVTTTNDEHLFGVGVRVHGEVSNHLLVGELVTLGALDNVVEDEDVAVVGRFEDEDVLVQGLFVV